MKKRTIIIAVIAAAVLAAIIFAAYHILRPGGIEAEHIEAVPENKYTESVPMPDFGEPQYVLDNSKDGSYAIFYKDTTREQGEQYIEKLKSEGYEEASGDAETPSIGTLLKKGDKTLSVSVSKDVLGIYILTDKK